MTTAGKKPTPAKKASVSVKVTAANEPTPVSLGRFTGNRNMIAQKNMNANTQILFILPVNLN